MSLNLEEGSGDHGNSDSKVSWVYQLSKEELIKELQQLGQETEGTVAELRRRLVTYLRAIPPKETSAPPATTPPPIQISGRGVSFELLDRLRKLNLRFDGKTDPVAFMEQMEQVREDYDIADHQMLKALPSLLQDIAWQWCMNYRQQWGTYYDFLTDFKTFFYPPDYRDNLEEEINRKVQSAHETARTFILEMQTKIRRHGGYSAEREMACIYRRLRPDYRQYIKRNSIRCITDLLEQSYEFEQLQAELKASPPRTTAPSPVHTVNRPVATTQRQEWENRRNTEPRPSTPRDNQRTECWRCGRMGHTRFNCRQPPRVFCSRCRTEGVLSRNCPCGNRSEPRQGNGQRPGPQRGQSSARPCRPQP